MKDSLVLLIQFVVAITPFALFYLKLRSDKKDEKKRAEEKEEARDKKEDERNEKQRKFFSEQIADLSSKFVGLEQLLISHISDSDFRQKFRNKFSNRVTDLLNASDLDISYKNILSYWLSNVLLFSLDFYYSEHREDDTKKLERILEQNFAILLSSFKLHVDTIFKETRMYNSEKLILSDFFEKVFLFNKSRVLVARLISNGLDDITFPQLMLNYIDGFYQDFLSALRLWRRSKKTYILSGTEVESDEE
jgi:hypothetical protein